jgi:hypothetical protein
MAPSPISCARSLYGKKKTFYKGKRIEKRKKKPKRPGPIFYRGDLRLAGL